MTAPNKQEIYQRILDKKLKDYAAKLEVELKSLAPKPIQQKPSKVAESKKSSPRKTKDKIKSSFRSKVNNLTSKVKFGALAGLVGAASIFPSVSSDLVSAAVKETNAQNAAKVLKAAHADGALVAKFKMDKANVPQHIQEKVLKDIKIFNAEDPTKERGAFLNLHEEGDNLWKANNIYKEEGMKGFNVISGHGNPYAGVVVGGGTAEEVAVAHLGSNSAKENRFLSAQGLYRELIKAGNYNPNHPLKLFNCEIGKGEIPQELADLTGQPVYAFTENVWQSGNTKGILGSFATKKEMVNGKEIASMDFEKPGDLKIFYPRDKSERGSVTNLFPDSYPGTVNPSRNSVRGSQYENVFMAPSNVAEGKNARELYQLIQNDKYFNKNLPINLQVPGLNKTNPQLLKDLAEIHGQPVTGYTGSWLTYHPYSGFSGAFEKGTNKGGNFVPDKTTRDIGTTHYPSNYVPSITSIKATDSKAPWLDYARAGVGIRESGMTNIIEKGVRQANNRSPEIDTFLKASNMSLGQAWCASFVDWALQQAGVQTIKGGAAVRNWKNFGTTLNQPAYGSVATYMNKSGSGGHAGFVIGKDAQDPSKVIMISGNQQDRIGYMRYDADKLRFNHPRGYAPDYQLESYDLKSIGLTPDTQFFDRLPVNKGVTQ